MNLISDGSISLDSTFNAGFKYWDWSADNHSQHRPQLIHFTNVASQWGLVVVRYFTKWFHSTCFSDRYTPVSCDYTQRIFTERMDCSKTPHSWETLLLTLRTYFRLISPKVILRDWNMKIRSTSCCSLFNTLFFTNRLSLLMCNVSDKRSI